MRQGLYLVIDEIMLCSLIWDSCEIMHLGLGSFRYGWLFSYYLLKFCSLLILQCSNYLMHTLHHLKSTLKPTNHLLTTYFCVGCFGDKTCYLLNAVYNNLGFGRVGETICWRSKVWLYWKTGIVNLILNLWFKFGTWFLVFNLDLDLYILLNFRSGDSSWPGSHSSEIFLTLSWPGRVGWSAY